jgi:hypothetical protein
VADDVVFANHVEWFLRCACTRTPLIPSERYAVFESGNLGNSAAQYGAIRLPRGAGECEVEPRANLSTVASFFPMRVGGAATIWILPLRGGEPQ